LKKEISSWDSEERERAWKLQGMGYDAEEIIERVKKEKIEGLRQELGEEERGDMERCAATLALEDVFRERKANEGMEMWAVGDRKKDVVVERFLRGIGVNESRAKGGHLC
jgi:hypothetical protein